MEIECVVLPDRISPRGEVLTDYKTLPSAYNGLILEDGNLLTDFHFPDESVGDRSSDT